MPSPRLDALTLPPFLNLGPGGGILGGGPDIICGAIGLDWDITGPCWTGGADIICGATGFGGGGGGDGNGAGAGREVVSPLRGGGGGGRFFLGGAPGMIFS